MFRIARRSAETILVDTLALGHHVDVATIADEAMHSLGEVIVVGDEQAPLRVRVIVALERRRRQMKAGGA